jgi:hypothetical protein
MTKSPNPDSDREYRRKEKDGTRDDREKSDNNKSQRTDPSRKDGSAITANEEEDDSSRGRSRKHRKKDEDKRDKRKRDRKRDDDERKHRKHSLSEGDSSDENERKRRRRRKSRHKKSSRKRSKSKKKRRYSSSSESSDDSSSSDSSSSSSSSGGDEGKSSSSKVVNQKLLAKLNARGETLEERNERRTQKRAAKITARFGYTAENNPFNDPNLHETFNWSKKKDKGSAASKQNPDTLEEIESIRRRREERDLEKDEMERLKAEESRMKELENYDEWAKKEEEFHLQQQRQRSAIRLVEGREKPVDVLAKNLLLFGLSDEEKKNRAAVKYQERYNALDELETLEAELEEPFKLLAVLKLAELKDLLVDIDAFRTLEREANPNNSIVIFWDALHLVCLDEIKLLQNGGDKSVYARKMADIRTIFEGQSSSALLKMKEEVEAKLRKSAGGAAYGIDGGVIDRDYWQTVLEQLTVHLAKIALSELHSKMLVRQLERLEQKKEELTKRQAESDKEDPDDKPTAEEAMESMVPKNVAADFGNLEEELGLTNEVDLAAGNGYSWQDTYRPRKPRYFNRVKTGYDWNKYNQTHYDHDTPPPKTVQGYKFNIFYPDLVDPTKTPQYYLEPADTDEFCILRFHAGPPYEDIAFKILNREWNRSRKRGFRCTFERGVLSIYFNFTSHWYRR